MSRPLLLFALLLAAASDVAAQPLFYTVETLDWMAADSQVIVRAVVVDFAQEIDADKKKWDTVVLKVKATLKGKHKPFHTFVIPNWNHFELARWKKTECELLVFLAETKPVDVDTRWWGEKATAYELTLRSGYTSTIELATPVKMSKDIGHLEKIYTLDLKDPTDPKEVVEYTRAAVAAEKVKLRKHSMTWPRGAATFTRIVPVTELLERQACKWVSADDQNLREEGARALKFFKSDENVTALKKLLKDDSFVVHVKQDGERIIQTHRTYRVRMAAFDSLKALGVEVPEPVLSEPLPRKK